MARQGGLLKVVGKLDDLSFYKSADGYLVRSKGGVSADRINSDPTFQRTRENNAEFGMSAAAGKLLRIALRNLMMTASDNRVTSRLTRLMTDVKNLDAANDRGERHVHEGFDLPEGKAVLKGFNFNSRAILSGILFKSYALNTTTGALDILGVIPKMDIVSAPGATHVTFKAGWSKLDFQMGEFETVISNSVNLPINNIAADINLTHAAPPALATGVHVFTLQIEFYQEVNGNQYSLKNGGYNALAVIDVV